MDRFSILIIFLIGLPLFALQCRRAPDYPIAPVIKLLTVSPDTLNPDVDSLKIRFSFTDGDGDLGYNNDVPNVKNDTTIFVKDIRPNSRGSFLYKYDMPYVPAKGSFKQITGVVNLNLKSNTSCRPDLRLFDTVKYEIKIRDRAGNTSNTITTQQVIFKCQ
jgi:hypothetical protein